VEFCRHGTRFEDEVFVGQGLMFTNDRFPRATHTSGGLQSEAGWKAEVNRVKRSAHIGTNATDATHATIISGVTIGAGTLVGSSAVMTTDVPTAPSTQPGLPGAAARPGGQDDHRLSRVARRYGD
jgi:acetyltransferase-like isoleucine patch superfamily enzyme